MGFFAQEHFCPSCVQSVFGATNGMKVMAGGGDDCPGASLESLPEPNTKYFHLLSPLLFYLL
jgi:hypothetical protein